MCPSRDKAETSARSSPLLWTGCSMASKETATPAQRVISDQQSLNGTVKTICDIMRRSNCAGALQYVPEVTWILFLRILDEREQAEAEAAEAVGADFTP